MRLDRHPAGGHTVAPVDISLSWPTPGPMGHTIPSPGGRVHRVVQGETLEAISGRYYHDGGGVGLIHAANLELIGADPRYIVAGQILSIPYPSTESTRARQSRRG